MWLTRSAVNRARDGLALEDDPLVELATDGALNPADEAPGKPAGFRFFVGGFLYIEGLVLLLCGVVLMTSYWPPYQVGEVPGSIISKVGLAIAGVATSYLVLVGVGMFIYNLVHPPMALPGPDSPVLQKAEEYRRFRSRPYLLDDNITCAEEADIALLARKTLR